MDINNGNSLRSQILTAAHQYTGGGLSVIPIRTDGSKAPTTEWKRFQKVRPTPEEIVELFRGEIGIGIIAGDVSGKLEILDFDEPGLVEQWAEIVEEQRQGLLSSLPRYETPSGGAHVFFRCSVIEGNQKLAQDAGGKVLIETRGRGGYVLASPSPASCHPSGREYRHIGGPRLPEISVISPEERTILFETARSFNQKPKRIEYGTQASAKGTRPGDDFNNRSTWDEILLPRGWSVEKTSGSTTFWRRPGKTDPGCSATTGCCGDLLYNFSSNGNPFEPDKAYSKFAAFALLEYGGNFSVAAAALAKKGFGKKTSPVDENGWAEEKPLQRPTIPPTPFPMKALGNILGKAAKEIAKVIKAPNAICGQSILAAAALAVQGHAEVVIDGRASPVSEFFLTIGESGERKSAVDNQALWPHRKYQRKLKEEYEQDFKIYQDESDAYKKAREDALKAKTLDEKKKALAALGDSPSPPLDPTLIAEEPTYEGLVKMLAIGQPSVGLFSDEGGRFIGGHGMNSDNLLKTASGLSSLWDGKPISRVRAGDGNTLLYGRRFSFHLMAQPNVSQLMLSNALLLEQGLLSRCLVTWPNSTAGTRKYAEVDLSASQEMKKYWSHLLKILETPLPLAEGKQNELTPRALPLSVEAKQLWIRFHDAIEGKLAEGGQLAPIRGLANKAPEHTARVAGILALIEDLKCESVSLDHMRSGIELVTHYLNEALRLFNSGVIDPDLVLAEKLLQWFRERGKSTVTLVEVYQFSLNSIRVARLARKIMNILVEHGWAMPIEGGEVFEDKIRKEAWSIRL